MRLRRLRSFHSIASELLRHVQRPLGACEQVIDGFADPKLRDTDRYRDPNVSVKRRFGDVKPQRFGEALALFQIARVRKHDQRIAVIARERVLHAMPARLRERAPQALGQRLERSIARA